MIYSEKRPQILDFSFEHCHFTTFIHTTNPSFTHAEKIGTGQQMQKWLRTGVVLGLFTKQYAVDNNISVHMLFGIPKTDGSTRPTLNLSDDRSIGFSVNNCLDHNLCTVEHAQTKEIIERVRDLGKNAWLWAKDLKDRHYNVGVDKCDIAKLGFTFDDKIYVYLRLISCVCQRSGNRSQSCCV